jgi:hypothetical protein|tara:strand:+ start:1709 stop:2257 length:549 start_codon:yes stop_codon:yes gene_type:complete
MFQNQFFIKKILFLIMLFFSFTSNAQSKKERRLAKKIEKMSNPKWLKIQNTKASFIDNKNSYIAKNSFDARSQNNGRLNNKGRKNLMYDNVGINRNSNYDYDRIESRVIQIALFLPEIKELEVQIEINCSEGYKDIQYLVIVEEDLRVLRSFNTQENFVRDIKVTDLNVFRKIELVHATLCK